MNRIFGLTAIFAAVLLTHAGCVPDKTADPRRIVPVYMQEKVKTREDEGVLVIVKPDGAKKPMQWNFYLQTKEYKWGLGLDDRQGKRPEVFEEAAKLEGKRIVAISRAGYFGLGKQKILLVISFKEKSP